MAETTLNNDVQSPRICNEVDESDSPLHVAALRDDLCLAYVLIRHDKEEIDVRRSDGKTPLMLAVTHNCPNAVKVLMMFNANIDAKDENGESALRMLFKHRDTDPAIIKEFLRRIENQHTDTEKLVEKLFLAGCTLYHAAFLEDVEVLGGLLERGVGDVDSTYFKRKTALHIAAESNQFQLVARLLDAGADANSLDEDGQGALCIAAANGNFDIVKCLLERGADPNAKAFHYGLTPLIAVLENSSEKSCQMYDECAELLLKYGAVPSQKIGDYPTVFDVALNNASFHRINLVICYVALREMQGTSIAKTMLQCKLTENQYALPKFREYYEMCQRTLRIEIIESVTLFDLISASERKLRIYMRNRSFYRAMTGELLDRVYELHRYYYVTLVDRLEKAPGPALENEAIEALCKVFRSEYNRCYVVARQVVDYLDTRDLEKLCEV